METVIRFGTRVWAGWLGIGHVIGDSVSRVVLTAIYFMMFLPFGAVARFFADPLQRMPRAGVSQWHERGPRGETLEEGKGLF